MRTSDLSKNIWISDEQLGNFQFPQNNVYMHAVCGFKSSDGLSERPFDTCAILRRRDLAVPFNPVIAKGQLYSVCRAMHI
jgi:hypothetical protein